MLVFASACGDAGEAAGAPAVPPDAAVVAPAVSFVGAGASTCVLAPRTEPDKRERSWVPVSRREADVIRWARVDYGTDSIKTE
jgi:hypothetical protein